MVVFMEMRWLCSWACGDHSHGTCELLLLIDGRSPGGRGVRAVVWSSEGCDAAVNSQGVPSCECDVTGVTSWRDGLITGIFHVRVIFTRGP